jgi:hypothetical protein
VPTNAGYAHIVPSATFGPTTAAFAIASSIQVDVGHRETS